MRTQTQTLPFPIRSILLAFYLVHIRFLWPLGQFKIQRPGSSDADIMPLLEIINLYQQNSLIIVDENVVKCNM